MCRRLLQVPNHLVFLEDADMDAPAPRNKTATAAVAAAAVATAAATAGAGAAAAGGAAGVSAAVSPYGVAASSVSASRSVSLASVSSDGSCESHLVEQEEMVALTQEVRAFKEALGRLRRIFHSGKCLSLSINALHLTCPVAAHFPGRPASRPSRLPDHQNSCTNSALTIEAGGSRMVAKRTTTRAPTAANFRLRQSICFRAEQSPQVGF